MIYRIKQFLWAITSPFYDIDIEFLNRHLDSYELMLFYQLEKSEQLHSIRVAKEIIIEFKKVENREGLKEINKEEAIKLGLLHDIGKGEYYVNNINKSLLVMISKIVGMKLKKYDNIKVVDSYYNHGKKGYDMLKGKDMYSEGFLQAIKNHHLNYDEKNKLLMLLVKCDDRS